MARDDLASTAELTCPKCHMFGCDCNPPQSPSNRPAMADTCIMCHRAKPECICRSHYPVTALPDDYTPSGRARRILSKQEVDARVNEAVTRCYDRDPKGLAALVRGWFE